MRAAEGAVQLAGDEERKQLLCIHVDLDARRGIWGQSIAGLFTLDWKTHALQDLEVAMDVVKRPAVLLRESTEDHATGERCERLPERDDPNHCSALDMRHPPSLRAAAARNLAVPRNVLLPPQDFRLYLNRAR